MGRRYLARVLTHCKSCSDFFCRALLNSVGVHFLRKRSRISYSDLIQGAVRTSGDLADNPLQRRHDFDTDKTGNEIVFLQPPLWLFRVFAGLGMLAGAIGSLGRQTLTGRQAKHGESIPEPEDGCPAGSHKSLWENHLERRFCRPVASIASSSLSANRMLTLL
jgi:hypothetical protein